MEFVENVLATGKQAVLACKSASQGREHARATLCKETPDTSAPCCCTKDHSWIVGEPVELLDSSLHECSELCRWMGTQAEELGVDVLPACAAKEAMFDGNGSVVGVITQDFGVAKDGSHKAGFLLGAQINARVTMFAEGCRGALSEVRALGYLVSVYSDGHPSKTPAKGVRQPQQKQNCVLSLRKQAYRPSHWVR
jgi:hypothetical protein